MLSYIKSLYRMARSQPDGVQRVNAVVGQFHAMMTELNAGRGAIGEQIDANENQIDQLRESNLKLMRELRQADALYDGLEGLLEGGR